MDSGLKRKTSSCGLAIEEPDNQVALAFQSPQCEISHLAILKSAIASGFAVFLQLENTPDGVEIGFILQGITADALDLRDERMRDFAGDAGYHPLELLPLLVGVRTGPFEIAFEFRLADFFNPALQLERPPGLRSRERSRAQNDSTSCSTIFSARIASRRRSWRLASTTAPRSSTS